MTIINQDNLAKAMERLMDDEGFVKAALGAAKATEATGKEMEYAIFELLKARTPPSPGCWASTADLQHH